MKTVFFAISQLVARSLDLHVIFSVVFHEYNGICYIGAYGMLSLLRCGKNDCISHLIVYIYSTKWRKKLPRT